MKALTFTATRWTLGNYDGATIGWFIINADGLDAASSLMDTVADLSVYEVPGEPRGTIDVVLDDLGSDTRMYLVRDPSSSVPVADTSGSVDEVDWPAAVVFVEGSGSWSSRKLLALIAVPELEPGFDGWEVDPAAGIADITDTADTVTEVVAGDNVTVDNTDPTRPIVSATGGGGGGGVGVIVSAVEPGAPAGGSGAWVRTPGDLRVFMDFRAVPDGPIPSSTNGGNPEDPALLASFSDYGAPFQPCVVIDGAVQSDMVTQVDPPTDTSTRTGFAIGVLPGSSGRIEWGHGGYAVPVDADLVSNITSNVAVSDLSGNAYLFGVVVGRVDPVTGDIDLGAPVSAGLRLIRDDFTASTSIGWHALDEIPVAGDRFGFSWDADGHLTGYHNGEAVMTATDTTYDISEFVSIGMPLHQDEEVAYFCRVAWIGISESDPVDPDAVGTHYWTGSAWRLNSVMPPGFSASRHTGSSGPLPYLDFTDTDDASVQRVTVDAGALTTTEVP